MAVKYVYLMWRGLLLAVLLTASGASFAEDPGLTLVDFGPFLLLSNIGFAEAENSSVGSIGIVVPEGIMYRVETTDQITATIGTVFGITFIAKNVRSFDTVPVEIQVSHPAMTLPDGRKVEKDSWAADAQEIPRFTGWHFEHPHELVPGKWTIAVLHNGKIAIEKAFEITLPDTE